MKPHLRVLRALRAAEGRLVPREDLAAHTGLGAARLHAALRFLTLLGLVGRRGRQFRAIGKPTAGVEAWIEASYEDVEWARRTLAA